MMMGTPARPGMTMENPSLAEAGDKAGNVVPIRRTSARAARIIEGPDLPIAP
jgi:hypothetical protein